MRQSNILYKKYVEAREHAWSVWDRLFWQDRMSKDDVLQNNEYLAAIQTETDAYTAYTDAYKKDYTLRKV